MATEARVTASGAIGAASEPGRLRRGVRVLRRFWGIGSGPLVARVFHRVLALVFLIAFASLGVQVDLLIGSDGLLPVGELMGRLEASEGTDWTDLPTLAWLWHSDAAIHTGIVLGLSLSALALVFPFPRLLWPALVVLYLSYCAAARTFLYFQWDNLLLECGLLATLLPRDRRAPVMHFLLRVLVVKLYVESGIAKWQSHLHDWHDGSAMTFYYETAPIPTWLGWYAHHLPTWWHHVESWFAMGFELLVAPLALGPRWAKLFAFAVLTGFQLLNIATANYGFFCYLALALHLFLLEDRDLARIGTLARRLRARLRGGEERAPPSLRTPGQQLGYRLADRLRRVRSLRDAAWERTLRLTAARWWRKPLAVLVVVPFAGVWLGISFRDAAAQFTDEPEVCEQKRRRSEHEQACWTRPDWLSELLEETEPVHELHAPLRLVHVYHLFGHITRKRNEPTFQTRGGSTADPARRGEGGGWSSHHLHYKAGPPDRPPPFVAPHQPRVDFRLWFYGLGFRRGMPRYVDNLLDRMCERPEAVEPLFVGELPDDPDAVRIRMYRYRFTDPGTKRRTGSWWTRERLGSLPVRTCP